INPYADGLLGRNELKLKLRRKAKRTKLMGGGVGGATASDVDLEEGIRTGWVCVNIGRVEGGELPEQAEKRERREAGLVGFGKGESGCSVVVQMMTEEKRGEIDLERLWMGMLRRQGKEREQADLEEREAGLEQGLAEGMVVPEVHPTSMPPAGALMQGSANMTA
ncbi:ATPase synthesis protein 25 mitochondrial, partial [Teratosphaeriaceae sp. CCFEE 6253]